MCHCDGELYNKIYNDSLIFAVFALCFYTINLKTDAFAILLRLDGVVVSTLDLRPSRRWFCRNANAY